MTQAVADENVGVATEELLKRESNEFCLESIFTLNFSCRGLFSLGCITKCLNMRILDLSSNHLSSVGELGILSALEHLNLNNNNISQLDGLHKLENLSRLYLAGNKICSFETLLPLSSLCKLEWLTLQLPSTPSQSHMELGNINPVCSHQHYLTTMLEIFPALVWLDREKVDNRGSGGSFYSKCRAIQNSGNKWSEEENHTSEELSAVELPNLMETSDDILDSEDKIKDLLAECKESSNRVQQFLSRVRHELKLSDTGLEIEH